MFTIIECVSHEESQKSCFFMISGHTRVQTTEATTEFGWTVFPHTPYSPDPALSDCHLFSQQKTVCRDIVTRMTRHCRMPRANGCRGRTATSTREEYKLLFKGGRRLLTKMVIILKIIYAFIDTVVKFCEISASLTCKYSRARL